MNPDDERRIVSFWASRNTQQLPAAMPSLHRWRDQDRLNYVYTHPGAKDPLEATLERLIKAGQVLEAMDRIGPSFVDRTERHQRLLRQIRDIAERLWLWHGAIRLLRSHMNSALLKTVMDASWVLTMKALLKASALQDTLANDLYSYPPLPNVLCANVWVAFPFIECMQRRKRGILFTHPTGAIKDLSLSQWNTTYYEFRRVYVRTGFSPSAAGYLEALVYQYAHFVNNQHESPQASERCYDMPMYRASGPELPNRLLNAPLNAELIRKHEPDLFFMIRHLRAAQTFYDAGEWIPLPKAERRAILKAFDAFVTDMIKDRRFFSSLAGAFRTNLIRRALQPGDSVIHHEKRGLRPSSTDYADAKEVLSTQRQEFASVVCGKNGFNKDTIAVHMSIWLAEQERIMASEPDENAAVLDDDGKEVPVQEKRACLWDLLSVERSNREFVILLILQTAYDTYAGYASRVVDREPIDLYRYAYLDDSALPPPRETPPDSPASARYFFIEKLGRKPPFLIVLSHMYAVLGGAGDVDDDPARVQVTPRLEEALILWMREAVRLGQLTKETIHPTLWPVVTMADAPVVAAAPGATQHGPAFVI